MGEKYLKLTSSVAFFLANSKKNIMQFLGVIRFKALLLFLATMSFITPAPYHGFYRRALSPELATMKILKSQKYVGNSSKSFWILWCQTKEF